MRNMETKRTNGLSNWTTLYHNAVGVCDGNLGTVSAARNGMRNLLYCTGGSLPRERDGKKVMCMYIDVQLLIQQTQQSAITAAYAYNARTLFRLVAYEADSQETGYGANIPADLFADPNLYSGTVGAGAANENLVQRPVNTKYRVLKDTIVDIERESLVVDGLIDDPIYAIADQRVVRFRLKVNKNFEYEETGNDSVCPHRTIQLVVIPFNNYLFGTAEIIGAMRCTHQMYFKDI